MADPGQRRRGRGLISGFPFLEHFNVGIYSFITSCLSVWGPSWQEVSRMGPWNRDESGQIIIIAALLLAIIFVGLALVLNSAI